MFLSCKTDFLKPVQNGLPLLTVARRSSYLSWVLELFSQLKGRIWSIFSFAELHFCIK